MRAAERRVRHLRAAAAFSDEAVARGRPSARALVWLERGMARAGAELAASEGLWAERRRRQLQVAARQQGGEHAMSTGAPGLHGKLYESESAGRDALVEGLRGQVEGLLSGMRALQLQRPRAC
jgi:hypothetical protein